MVATAFATTFSVFSVSAAEHALLPNSPNAWHELLAAEDHPQIAPSFGDQLLPVKDRRFHQHQLTVQLADDGYRPLDGDFALHAGSRWNWFGGVDLNRGSWGLQSRSRLVWSPDGALGPGHSDQSFRALLRLRGVMAG